MCTTRARGAGAETARALMTHKPTQTNNKKIQKNKQPIGERVLTAVSKKTDKPVADAALVKWNESCWKMCAYVGLVAAAAAIAVPEPWFWDQKLFWDGATAFPLNNLHVKAKSLWFYYVELGFYIQAVPFLMFIEVCGVVVVVGVGCWVLGVACVCLIGELWVGSTAASAAPFFHTRHTTHKQNKKNTPKNRCGARTLPSRWRTTSSRSPCSTTPSTPTLCARASSSCCCTTSATSS